jgi:hypothetical protein
MTDAPTSPAVIPAEAGTPCPADAADWARPYALRQLEMLGELAELGLDVARAVERQAREPSAAPDGPLFKGDLALAYARVSRAVRLTLMLQSKLIEDMKAAEKAGAEERKSDEPTNRAKIRVDTIVQRISATQHAGEPEMHEWVLREAAERLDDEDVFGDLLERPISESVARLCKQLGLEPDWAELAEELWAVREMESGHVGWPLRNPQPRAEAADDDPEDPSEPDSEPEGPRWNAQAFHQRLQELARDPAVIAAARRNSS